MPRVKDLTATALVAEVKGGGAPRDLAVRTVVKPFAPDLDRERRLLKRKLAAGAEFLQPQMVFDLAARRAFLYRAADLRVGIHFYASVRCCASERMADHVRRPQETGRLARGLAAGPDDELATAA